MKTANVAMTSMHKVTGINLKKQLFKSEPEYTKNENI